MSDFEWDENKNLSNQEKLGISFEEAQLAFKDPNRIIAVDKSHSTVQEKRFYCIGKIKDGVLTVRFTYRSNKVRIIGSGFWRKGKDIYEKEN